MKKQIVITALLMLLSAPLFAGHVSEATAQRIAENFLKAKTHSKVEVALLEFEEKSDFPNFYVFGNEHCFVIVSADDCVHPILGYSTENGFGTRQMPENVKAWMQSYQDGIATAVANNYSATEEIAAQWSDLIEGKDLEVKSRNAVGPLVQTEWNQFSPYNLLCPEGTVTGCVATAMAQVMRYWSYPQRGLNSHSYYCGYSSNNLYAAFGDTDYDWGNMPYVDCDYWNEDEQLAVATLMYHCGIAVDMDYHWLQSGADFSTSIYALVNYFNYDTDIRLIQREDDEVWIAELVNELDNGRPILYAGGSHAFVCDGYDESGYFHYNLGWGGMSDGYYLIDNIVNGYSNGNEAIVGIQPSLCNAGIPSGVVCAQNENNVELQWDTAENAEFYYVYRNETFIGGTSSTSFIDFNASSGTNVYYVRSLDVINRLSIGSRWVTDIKNCETLPIVFHFDDIVSDCISVNDEGVFYVTEGLYYGENGKSMVFHPIENDGIATLPELDLTMNDKGIEVAFMWYHSVDCGNAYVQVQYSTDGTTWNNAGQKIYRESDLSQWELKTIYVPELANEPNAQIRLYFGSTYYGCECFMDDLLIKEAPCCFVPSNIKISEVLHNTAKVQWSASSCATVFTIAYGPKGTLVEEMATINTTNNYLVLENLTPSTEYDLAIKAFCPETGETTWSDIASFSTLCSPSLPQIYDFEDGTQIPGCFTIEGNGYVYVSTFNPPAITTGGGLAVIVNRPLSVTLAPIDMTNVDYGIEVGFRWYCEHLSEMSYEEERQINCQVQYSVDAINWFDVGPVASIYDVITIWESIHSGWESCRVFIPRLSDETVAFVKLSFTGGALATYMFVDDITIQSASAYSPPYNIKITGATDISASFSWYEYGEPVSYKVAYGPKGVSIDEMNIVETNNNGIVISNLLSGTEYDLMVKSVFSNENESDWTSEFGFQTPCGATTNANYSFDEDNALDCIFVYGDNEAVTTTTEYYYGSEGSSLALGGSPLRVVFPPMDFSGANRNIEVCFKWYSGVMGWYLLEDFIQIQYSLDGKEWVSVGDPVYSNRPNGWGWQSATVEIPELTGVPFVYIGLLSMPNSGWLYSCKVDNIQIKEKENYIYITEDTQVENLTIAEDQVYVIQSPAVLTVSGDLVNNGTSSNLIIEDGGQLIHNNEVEATMVKNVVDCWNWKFISSPLTNPIEPNTTNHLISESGAYDLYYYEELSQYWKNHKQGSFTIMNGQGYLFSSCLGIVLSYEGTLKPSNNPVIVDLDYNPINNPLAGWNLVGNPFPCNAYISSSYYVINEEGTAIEPIPVSASTAISPCAGVMVKADESGQSVSFDRIEPELMNDKQGILQITVKQAHTQSVATLDKAIISFNPNDKLAKFYFGESDTQICIMQGEEEFSIAYVEEHGEVQVNFKTIKDGEYTLTVNPEMVQMDYLHLIDNLTGVDIDLLVLPSYTFEATTTDRIDRFALALSKGTRPERVVIDNTSETIPILPPHESENNEPAYLQISYDIIATANPAEGGTLFGAGSYLEGALCTLTAIANPGYAFTNWVQEGTVVSTESSYTFTVTQNADFVANFTAMPITQTVELVEGWTWYTPTVQTNIESIQSSLGNNLQLIQAKDGTPSGNIVAGQMYKIQTTTPCTLAVVGMPIISATVNINYGPNWFGFVGTEKTVTEAFANFSASEGDKVISQNEGFAVYENGGWSGTLENLRPGKGYVYISNATTPKTLVIGQ
jgi:hypothetical protein